MEALKKIGIVVIIILAIFIIFGIVSMTNIIRTEEIPINEKVMYGYSSKEEYFANRTELIKYADEKFIASIKKIIDEKLDENITDTKIAAKEMCATGSEYYNIGETKTAIKRFNQAWLLDDTEPCSYANFGYYLAFNGELERSFEMYEKAFSFATEEESWWIHTDYGEVLGYCYVLDDSRKDCLENSKKHLDQSLEIINAPKTHRALAIYYASIEDFNMAWNEVHLALEGGVSEETLMGLIEGLSSEMRDPKGIY